MINKLLIPELNSDEPPRRLEIRHRPLAGGGATQRFVNGLAATMTPGFLIPA
jgi:hypothetical protein